MRRRPRLWYPMIAFNLLAMVMNLITAIGSWMNGNYLIFTTSGLFVVLLIFVMWRFGWRIYV